MVTHMVLCRHNIGIFIEHTHPKQLNDFELESARRRPVAILASLIENKVIFYYKT